MKTKLMALMLAALACQSAVAGPPGSITKMWQKNMYAFYYDDSKVVAVDGLLSSRGAAYATYFQFDRLTGETKECWSDELTLTQSFSLQNPGTEVRFVPKGGDCGIAQIVVICHGIESTRVYTGEATSVGRAGGGVAHMKSQWWIGAQCSITGAGIEYVTTETGSHLDEDFVSDKYGR
jgi:hypothetical protein